MYFKCILEIHVSVFHVYMNNHMHDCNNKAKVLIQNFYHNNTKWVDFLKQIHDNDNFVKK